MPGKLPTETRTLCPNLRVGVDAVSIEKTRNLLTRFGERFTNRVFTPAEQALCEKKARPAESYAARFAAKEAVMKILSPGRGSGVRMKQIEVLSGPEGEPRVSLHAAASARAKELGLSSLSLSLTHEAGMAVAVAAGLAWESPRQNQ